MPPAMRSSKSFEYPTPKDFFQAVAAEFGPFDLDVCATPANAKVEHYFINDGILGGLGETWTGRVWMNPPYGPKVIGEWVRKAYESAQAGATVVCLLPSRTDTTWWHRYCLRASEIRFVQGRLRFGGSRWNAPFPSVIVIFRPPAEPTP